WASDRLSEPVRGRVVTPATVGWACLVTTLGSTSGPGAEGVTTVGRSVLLPSTSGSSVSGSSTSGSSTSGSSVSGSSISGSSVSGSSVSGSSVSGSSEQDTQKVLLSGPPLAPSTATSSFTL